MTKEYQIEEHLIQQLKELKYSYRPDIVDRKSLEQNFKTKFEALNRVRLSENEFLRLREEIIHPDVFAASKLLRERQYFQREDGTPLGCGEGFLVAHSVGQELFYKGIGILFVLQGQGAGLLEGGCGIVALESDEAVAGFVELLGMPGQGKYAGHQLCQHRRALLGLLKVVFGAAVEVVLVLGAEVLAQAGVAARGSVARVSGHLRSLYIDAHQGMGVADFGLLTDMEIGHAVIVFIGAEQDVAVRALFWGWATRAGTMAL